MLRLGNTAREIRESFGVNQKEAAQLLGVTSVHLCNVEKDKAAPSNELMGKYREVFGIDLYVAAWCMHGDVESLPRGVQEATRRLADVWRAQMKMRDQGMRGQRAVSSANKAPGASIECEPG